MNVNQIKASFRTPAPGFFHNSTVFSSHASAKSRVAPVQLVAQESCGVNSGTIGRAAAQSSPQGIAQRLPGF